MLDGQDNYPPYDIARTSEESYRICRDLRLAEKDDPLRDIVAKAIIECAQTSERDIIRLRNARIGPCSRRAGPFGRLSCTALLRFWIKF
jgi:hypothetical protein